MQTAFKELTGAEVETLINRKLEIDWRSNWLFLNVTCPKHRLLRIRLKKQAGVHKNLKLVEYSLDIKRLWWFFCHHHITCSWEKNWYIYIWMTHIHETAALCKFVIQQILRAIRINPSQIMKETYTNILFPCESMTCSYICKRTWFAGFCHWHGFTRC